MQQQLEACALDLGDDQSRLLYLVLALLKAQNSVQCALESGLSVVFTTAC